MKLISFECKGTGSIGVLEDNIVVDLGKLLCEIGEVESMVDDLLPVIEAGDGERLASVDMRSVLETGRFAKDISDVELCAPIKRPPKISCIGRNYAEHVKESMAAGKERNIFSNPLLFAKPPNSVIGPSEKILIPEESNEVDYEVELGVVIGKPGFKVTPEEAPEFIFGYTVLNDVTARDLQREESQWYRAKGFATFCPIGPCIVTADEIDPMNLDLELTVNGEVRQRDNTKNMICSVYELISILSHVTPLEPGDLIGTGTPAGVGAFMKTPKFLEPGDVIAATIQGIGTLESEVA